MSSPTRSPALRSALARALPETRRGWLLWAGVVVGIGLLSFTRYHLAKILDGAAGEGLETFVDEMTAALGAGALFFGVRALVRAAPLAAGGPDGALRALRRLPAYLAGLLVFSALHTLSNWGLREVVYRAAGLGDYDYGSMPARFAMELPYDVLAFVIMVAVVVVTDHLRAAREREIRAARLESSLARAELRSLRLQLQPHFLFNALNTISSTMYDDPAAADEMIDRLAELLRASLRTAGADGEEPPEEVPLADELEVLDAYLALMTARFRERLEVALAIDPAVRGARVPPLLLQPLVENAVRHGGAERTGRGRIEIRAERAGGSLRLTVEDDGPGAETPAGAIGAGAGAKGLGLSATAERLQILYGDEHRFEAGNIPGGGFRVAIRLPFRTAARTSDTSAA